VFREKAWKKKKEKIEKKKVIVPKNKI